MISLGPRLLLSFRPRRSRGWKLKQQPRSQGNHIGLSVVLIFTIRLTKYQWNLSRYDSDLRPLEMDMNFFTLYYVIYL